MASKRRIRRQECDGKRQLTKEEAHATARRMSKQQNCPVHAYRCHFGSHYHVGHAYAPKAQFSR